MDGLFEMGTVSSGEPATRSGGSLAGSDHASAPLAVRMRPRTLEELAGQRHLLAPGSPLRRLVEGDQPMSLLLWGPPGSGKTTIASILSLQTDRRFVEVSAVAAPPSPRSSAIAWVRTARTSSSVSGCSRSSRLRDISGEITLKKGFSVVAATSVTQRFSTPGSSASCWAL